MRECWKRKRRGKRDRECSGDGEKNRRKGRGNIKVNMVTAGV
jgi:hypothetical protein